MHAQRCSCFPQKKGSTGCSAASLQKSSPCASGCRVQECYAAPPTKPEANEEKAGRNGCPFPWSERHPDGSNFSIASALGSQTVAMAWSTYVGVPSWQVDAFSTPDTTSSSCSVLGTEPSSTIPPPARGVVFREHEPYKKRNKGAAKFESAIDLMSYSTNEVPKEAQKGRLKTHPATTLSGPGRKAVASVWLA